MNSRTLQQEKNKLNNKKMFEGGEITYSEGIPHLKLSGTYFEMGKQYGTLLKEELHEINQISRKFFKKVVPGFLKPLSNVYLNRRAKKMKHRIPEVFREEMRGMAAGSGLSYKDLLSIASFPEIFLGCTTVLTRINGNVVLARNLDFLPFLGSYSAVVEYKPLTGGVVTSIGIIGYGGLLTGFNDKGLSLSLNTIALAKKEASDEVMIGYKNRAILENAESLEEADGMLSQYRSEVGWLITIASSRENNGFVYEIATTGNKKHELNEQDYLAVNNSFIDHNLNRENMGVLTSENFRNRGRHEGLKDQLNNHPVKNQDDLVQLLMNVTFYEYEGIELGLGHYAVNNEQSIQSIIIDYTNKTFLLAAGEGYSGFDAFYRYRINQGFIDVYREKLDKKAVQELLDKRDRMMDLFLAKDFKGLADLVDLDEKTNIYEISGLVDLDVKKDNQKLLESIEQEIKHYEHLPELHIKKGIVLIDLGRYEEAVSTLEVALNLPYVFEADQVMIYRYLAKAAQQLGNKDRSHEYAVKCIELIEQYVVGKSEKEIIKEVSSYRFANK